MNIPLMTSKKPGIPGEVRYNVDTNEMQAFDGKQWRVIGEPTTVALWKKWRAWYPVKVNGKWAWGKTVYRQWVSRERHGFWKYGTIFDVLKDV